VKAIEPPSGRKIIVEPKEFKGEIKINISANIIV
jgi:hypothetical protein